MPYSFNPHSHVKIWFSLNKKEWMNLTNRLRLIRMRLDNPRDHIYLVYDKHLLSSQAVEDLEKFCREFNIHPKDVHTEIFPHCQSEEERNLIKLYDEEISAIGHGGCAGLASDALRFLEPIYRLGVYSDLDVWINTEGLAEDIPVETPVLFAIRMRKPVSLNVDCFAVIDLEEARPIMQAIQRRLYDNQNRLLCKQLTSPKYSRNAQQTQIQMTLNVLAAGKTSLELRQYLYSESARKAMELMFIIHTEEISPIREGMTLPYSASAYILAPPNEVYYYNHLTKKISATQLSKMDYGVLQVIFEAKGFTASYKKTLEKVSQLFHAFLHDYLVRLEVVLGGPGALNEILRHFKREERPFFSFEYYALNLFFCPQMVLEQCDLSWTEVGRKLIHRQENKMHKAAEKIQAWWRDKRDKRKPISLPSDIDTIENLQPLDLPICLQPPSRKPPPYSSLYESLAEGKTDEISHASMDAGLPHASAPLALEVSHAP